MIGAYGFSRSRIRSFLFPPGVRHVGPCAFQGCQQLQSVMLNEGLKTLGIMEQDSDGELAGMAFAESGIESVQIPATLRKLEKRTFFQCRSLQSAEFSNGLAEIGAEAFAKSGIRSVVLPPSVRTIDKAAFAQCRRLRSARLNDGVERIGEKCFSDSGLSELTLPRTVWKIGDRALSGPGLEFVSVVEGCPAALRSAIPDNVPVRTLTTLAIPKGTERIERGQFSGERVYKITVPKSVVELGSDAFGGWVDLREVAFEAGSRLERIGQNAFWGCANLVRIAFPAGLQRIGAGAFRDSGLEGVIFPDSLRTVGQGAFANCKSLRVATLNEGLEVLGVDRRAAGSSRGALWSV